MKNNTKTSRGITLIALVVTIIVLLILAGISIQMLTGNNGILQRAGDAKGKTEEGQKQEIRRMSAMEAATNLEDTTYQGVTIPAGFAPTKVEGESTVDEGLVITDASGNEYVWIEVPNDGTGPIYTAVESEDEDSENYYTAIETSLRNYYSKDSNNGDLITTTDGTEATKDYKTTTAGFKDEWYSGCGITSSESYTALYKKMLKSVYKNGGFWIGRYEAGTSNPRRSSANSIDGLIPLSKVNLYPLNYVTCSKAQILADRVLSTNVTKYNSSLMFGIQWDLVLKYLSNKGVSTADLTSDSKNWGNYCDNSFDLNRGKYSVVSPWNEYIDYTIGTEGRVIVENGVSKKIGITAENRILLTTGASDINSKKNIYDLAGNVFEWTLEHATSNSNAPCSLRGGYFAVSSAYTPSSYRNYYNTNYSSYSFGFRVSLY